MSSELKSTGWIRDGALWSYHKPPTREEKLQQTIRSNKELRDSWMERHPELQSCPECDSGNYGTTLMGWFMTDEHYHDPNRKTCADCGHVWKSICPTCGQEGGF